MPHVPLELREISVATQRTALAEVDAALVRLPVENADDLHVIPLYDELPVVVMSTESALTAADDEVTLADLSGEVVIVPDDDVLAVRIPDAATPACAPPADTAEAIATVAAGVGVVIVPMSLARAHQRRDVEYRVLRDGPTSTVALAWPRDATTDDVETFIGIVRGRTARSSRGERATPSARVRAAHLVDRRSPAQAASPRPAQNGLGVDRRSLDEGTQIDTHRRGQTLSLAVAPRRGRRFRFVDLVAGERAHL